MANEKIEIGREEYDELCHYVRNLVGEAYGRKKRIENILSVMDSLSQETKEFCKDQANRLHALELSISKLRIKKENGK